MTTSTFETNPLVRPTPQPPITLVAIVWVAVLMFQSVSVVIGIASKYRHPTLNAATSAKPVGTALLG